MRAAETGPNDHDTMKNGTSMSVRRCAVRPAAVFLVLLSLSGQGAGFGARKALAAHVVAYYRFEEGSANAPAVGAILDAVDSSPDGTPAGGPVYRSDVPAATIPQTGGANTLSIEFNGSQSVLFNSLFVFHAGYRDATLEFFIKAPDQPHHSIFWTRGDDNDTNRYNIAVNGGGGFGLDYRDPSGSLHMQAGISVLAFPPGIWTHVAVTRDTVSAAPAQVYRFYRDGAFVGSMTDPTPDLPTLAQWTISGRSPYRFVGLLDEIRLSNRVLAPHEFLIATPSPDADHDGVPDAADNCPNTIPGVPVDAQGCPPPVPGDFDRDGDVDADDLAVFASCDSAPGVEYAGDCAKADFDNDQDVDQSDFARFQRCYSGEGKPGNCATTLDGVDGHG